MKLPDNEKDIKQSSQVISMVDDRKKLRLRFAKRLQDFPARPQTSRILGSRLNNFNLPDESGQWTSFVGLKNNEDDVIQILWRCCLQNIIRTNTVSS